MVKIICEGSDDKTFLRLLLNDLKNTSSVPDIENFDELKTKLKNLFKGMKI